MFSESEIRDQINQYLVGEQSFEEFEDWLVEQSRVRYLDNSPVIRSMVGEIRYLMFEVIEGEIDENIFKNRLRELIGHSENYMIFEQPARVIIPRYASASQTYIANLAPARIPLEVEYV
ncbi:MAG: hypothetical protein ACREBD_02560 [Blastocatellia bacterium]